MIDITDFKDFLVNYFDSKLIFYDEFKPDLQFAEVDCFIDKPYKIAIEISKDVIKVGTVSKEPVLDFSLHEHVFETNKEAERFILDIQ